MVIVADGSDIPGGNRHTVEILNHVAAYCLAGLIPLVGSNLFRHTRRLIRASRSNGLPSPAKTA